MINHAVDWLIRDHAAWLGYGWLLWLMAQLSGFRPKARRRGEK